MSEALITATRVSKSYPQNGGLVKALVNVSSVSYTHLRAHETVLDLVCRLLLEKNKKTL